MAQPAYTKVPTAADPTSPVNININTGLPEPQHTPVSDNSPCDIPSPPYSTIHRPPRPLSISSSQSDDDDNDTKTIKINITIKIPKHIHFPCFRRKCRRGGDGEGQVNAREDFRIPRAEKRRRFVAVLLTLFYISFLICQAVAWDLQGDVYGFPLAAIIIGLFSGIIDFFITFSTIMVVKRYREGQTKPGFRFGFLLAINIALFILHIGLLANSACHIGEYGYGWYYNGKMKTMVGLTIYPMITLTIIKLLLAAWVLCRRSAVRAFGESVKHIGKMVASEFREAVTEEEEAVFVVQREDRGDARRSQEGRLYLP